MGYWAELDESGREVRSGETFTCCHCNIPFRIVHGAERYRCRKCDSQPRAHSRGWVCAKCHATGRCLPFEKAMDLFEKKVKANLARDAMFVAIGLE